MTLSIIYAISFRFPKSTGVSKDSYSTDLNGAYNNNVCLMKLANMDVNGNGLVTI